MNHAEPRCRVYDPDALEIMGRAFDKAFSGLSPQFKADPNIRQSSKRTQTFAKIWLAASYGCLMRVRDRFYT